MQDIIINIMNQFGYFGVALLIMVENIFPPIPSEIILTFGGFMTTKTSLNVPGVIIAATIGSVLGAAILYWVGRVLNAERLKAVAAGKVGQILRFKVEDIEKAEGWFEKHGKITIFFTRFVPIVRSLISIPAGTTKMPFLPFLVLTTLGTAIWNTVLVLLGSTVGDNWEKIAHVVDRYSHYTLLVLIMICVIVVIWFVYTRFISKKSKK